VGYDATAALATMRLAGDWVRSGVRTARRRRAPLNRVAGLIVGDAVNTASMRCCGCGVAEERSATKAGARATLNCIMPRDPRPHAMSNANVETATLVPHHDD
jgi:hypothetical protein